MQKANEEAKGLGGEGQGGCVFECFERLERGESVGLGDQFDGEAAPPPGGPRLGVLSSGSTGKVRRVWKSWEGLKAQARVSPRRNGWHWATPFRADSFAGIQVAIQAWRDGGTCTFWNGDRDSLFKTLAERPVHGLSTTPTFIDLLLQQETSPMGVLQPQQITVGGEVLRPACAERIRSAFPRARFSVIYGSAEHGVVLKTHRMDGWYEVASMERRFSEWRVCRDGDPRGEAKDKGVLELRLHSGEWVTTGDRVEHRGDLIRIIGRADRVANVGGIKVGLDEVTTLAEQVPGVRRAWAEAEPNGVTGEVVRLRYCLEEGLDGVALERGLQGFLRENLPKAAWPRRWVLDPVLPVNNGKRGWGRVES